ANEQRRRRDEEDGLRADEAVRLGGGVEHRRQLVHQRDQADGEPGEVPLPALGEAEQPGLQRQGGEERQQEDVEPEEDEDGHASSSEASLSPAHYWRADRGVKRKVC